MTKLLTTRSYDSNIGGNIERIIDYDRAFMLSTDKENIKKPNSEETVEVDVLTIPCDGIIYRGYPIKYTGISLSSGESTTVNIAINLYQYTPELKYYKANASTKYGASKLDLQYCCIRLLRDDYNRMEVWKGQKFISSHEVPIPENSTQNGHLIMIPYKGVDIEWNGKVTLNYWDYPSDSTQKFGLKTTSIPIEEGTSFSDLPIPNNFNTDFTITYLKYDGCNYETYNEYQHKHTYTFVGWLNKRVNNTEPLTEEQLYQDGRIKYSSLYAIYQNENGKYRYVSDVDTIVRI